METTTIALSPETPLVYVLRESGCRGRLTTGRIERAGPNQITVYDNSGALFTYVSGAALRSWCVIDEHGAPLECWNAVMPEDVEKVLSYRDGLT